MVYYGYRYYNTNIGHWLSRDPIGEEGGVSLYSFVGNVPNSRVDNLGLFGNDGIVPKQPNGASVWEILGAWWRDRHSATRCETDKRRKCEELRKLLRLAYVANDVYSDNTGPVKGAEAYERLSDNEILSLGLFPQDFRDIESGYHAGLYRYSSDGKPAYLVAYRGTEPSEANDDITDLAQIFRPPSAQYIQAANLGNILGEKFAGRISGVGHSLGGGLSVVGGLRGNFRVTTFNPAGVRSATATSVGADLAQAQFLVDAYSVPGDPVSQIANRLPLFPSTDGRRHMLADPGGVASFGGVDRHKMKAVIQAIKNSLRNNDCVY